MSQRLQVGVARTGGFEVVIIENRHGADRTEAFKTLKAATDFVFYVFDKNPEKQEMDDYLDPEGAKKRAEAKKAVTEAKEKAKEAKK